MALILGIDRFMSECRALTNFVGNGVAAIVVSKWEGELDTATMQRELANPSATNEAVVEDAAPVPILKAVGN
jgi:aerobic C4-dicarboxylate transport protein